jgi:PadR family transcriptional regulator PadR
MNKDNKLSELLSAWEETYKKGQLTLWIFLSLKDGNKYVDEIKLFVE